MSLERFTTLFPRPGRSERPSLALVHPPLFSWFRQPLITIGLAPIAGNGPRPGATRFPAGQSTAPRRQSGCRRPVCGDAESGSEAIAVILRLPAPLAVGLILVGCCPGGTASNVVTLIAKGDVALSVVMTSVKTWLCPGADATTDRTPGQPVRSGGWRRGDPRCGCAAAVVLVPLACGVLLKQGMPTIERTKKLAEIMPPLERVAIELIRGRVVGRSTRASSGAGSAVAAGLNLLLHTGGSCWVL